MPYVIDDVMKIKLTTERCHAGSWQVHAVIYQQKKSLNLTIGYNAEVS